MDILLFNWLLARNYYVVSSLICETSSSFFAQQNCTTKLTIRQKHKLTMVSHNPTYSRPFRRDTLFSYTTTVTTLKFGHSCGSASATRFLTCFTLSFFFFSEGSVHSLLCFPRSSYFPCWVPWKEKSAALVFWDKPCTSCMLAPHKNCKLDHASFAFVP
jgi:hypothetical protein